MNTSTRTLLSLAREMRLPVSDDHDPLTEGDAEKLRTLHALTGGTMPSRRPAEIIPGFTPGTIVPVYDPMTAAIENNLGVHRLRRRGRTAGPRRPAPRRNLPPVRQPEQQSSSQPRPEPVHRPPLTGVAATAVRLWPHLPDTIALAVAAKWAQCGFTELETTAWWEGEVPFNCPDIARELESYRVTPAHLLITSNKETVGTRIREGRLNPRQIAELLRREGHLQDAG